MMLLEAIGELVEFACLLALIVMLIPIGAAVIATFIIGAVLYGMDWMGLVVVVVGYGFWFWLLLERPDNARIKPSARKRVKPAPLLERIPPLWDI